MAKKKKTKKVVDITLGVAVTPGWEIYAKKIERDEIVSGALIKKSVARYRRLRATDGIEFRENRVKKVIAFFSILKHFTGKHANQPFILQPWQEFIIANIYGFYKNDKRLVRRVYIEMARKQGKTAFAAGLALYGIIGDDEMSAEVDLAANSKEQAKIAFDFCNNFARGIDAKSKYLVRFRDKILYKKMLSKLQVFASDDSKLDGFNASMYILDEYHAAKNGKMLSVLQSSQGMREHPLGLIITTAGFDKLGPCYQYRTMCTEVLSGVSDDDSVAAFIFSLDEGDEWSDPEVWGKSNPNLGVTVTKNFIEGEVNAAKNLASAEVGVRTKNINQWCDSINVWIPDHYIMDATQDINVDDFAGEECYAGIDLNSTTDLASLALCWRRDGKTYFKCLYYLPQESLKENRFKDLYGEWHRRGFLKLTPGNVTDYDIILEDLKDFYNRTLIVKVGYDAWNATQFVTSAIEQSMPMEAFSQTIGNFNRPTKEMERLILSGGAVIDNNEINRHCFRNVAMSFDRNGNTKPSKQFQEKKIDGVIAMLQSLGMLQLNPRWNNEL